MDQEADEVTCQFQSENKQQTFILSLKIIIRSERILRRVRHHPAQRRAHWCWLAVRQPDQDTIKAIEGTGEATHQETQDRWRSIVFQPDDQTQKLERRDTQIRYDCLLSQGLRRHRTNKEQGPKLGAAIHDGLGQKQKANQGGFHKEPNEICLGIRSAVPYPWVEVHLPDLNSRCYAQNEQKSTSTHETHDCPVQPEKAEQKDEQPDAVPGLRYDLLIYPRWYDTGQTTILHWWFDAPYCHWQPVIWVDTAQRNWNEHEAISQGNP